MKNYGERESDDNTTLIVYTNHDLTVGIVVRDDAGFLLTFLDLEDVAGLITQLTEWLGTQQKGLKA